MSKFKIIYWVLTLLFSSMMLFSGINFLYNHSDTVELFARLGYGSFLVIPLAIAKILGVIAIITRLSKNLKMWAYVGFFFDFGMAGYSHIIAEDGMFMRPFIAIVLLIGVIYSDTKAFA